MKLITKCFVAWASILSSFAHANQFYVGTDFSRMTLDQTEFNSVNVNNILAGYEFNHWAIEGSYNISNTHNDFYGGDQKINMVHLYGVYRSQETLFYKIKFGVTNERYKFYDSNGTLKLDDVHAGIARGVGVGYRFDQFNVELEYSWLGGSLETFGIGVRYHFN
ncbi:hypothetical protein ACWU4D_02385 [Vibrio sp. WJH972]